MRASRRVQAIAAGLLCCGLLSAAASALDFPPLTGRVVDQANVMTAESRTDIEAKSKELEDKSSIQLVVATVQSLQGSDIETYANGLFRFWKLGQAQKNNGVLLLVAPVEHKVRIEVGYGLEGTLTDALSSVIISSAIVPRFKSNDFSGGIARGIDGIISVLNGDTADWQPIAQVRQDDNFGGQLFAVILLFCMVTFLIVAVSRNIRSGHTVTRNGRQVYVHTGGSSSSSWSSSDSSDSSSSSDFSGGGGSSGGGGASGSW
jgi:uncharacterized protein